MEALLIALITWLSTNYDLPANYEFPAVRFATPTEIASVRYGFTPQGDSGTTASNNSMSANHRQSTVSVYEDKAKTIVLPVGWQGRTAAELSILVHEMVHHLQNLSGQTYACPQEREALAYEAQEKWLGLFGQSLSSEFGIDGMTLLVRTKCIN
jgi:hypothetical protein